MLRLGIISFFLILLSGCVAPVNIFIPQHEPAPLHLHKHPRVALVLGGGGARGYAHVGVIKALAKSGIPIDLIVGASAGSIVGALYADSADAQFVERTMRKSKFFDFADFSFIPYRHGIISGRKLQHFLIDNMRSRWFNDLRIPLIVVTTDLYSGQAKIISSGPIPPAVNASAAMPGVVQPVELYGHTLIDGGMVAQVPVNIAKRYHPDIIIAVSLEEEIDKNMPTTFVGVFKRAFNISISAIADYSGQGADVKIHPLMGNAGIFDVSKKNLLIHAGEVAGEKALPEIRALLNRGGAHG